MKKIGDYENINSVNPLSLIIGEVDEYIGESNGNKYLTFDSTGKNKEVLKKYTELWNVIKNKIKTINSVKARKYRKKFIKTKFNSANNLPLNKTLKLHM